MIRVAILAAAVAVSLASASAPKPKPVDKSATFTAPLDEVWSAVIEAFATNSWPISNMEKDSGLIVSDWMPQVTGSYLDCGNSGITVVESRTIQFNVFVRAKGNRTKVTVNVVGKEVRRFDNARSEVRCYSNGRAERRIHRMVQNRIGGE